ncbi:MAG: biotin/lipoyl-binding protein [Flavobacteriales bacterium]|nr:biotin/lipoyl-binding protein [Flavobacteriales bacterium]
MERATPTAAWTLPGRATPDVIALGTDTYGLVMRTRSFSVVVVKEDAEEGVRHLLVGGRIYRVTLQDDRAELIQRLGLDRAARVGVPEVKAPMPGLVLNILVKPGQVVKKNEPVLVLEAMKMENVIRAPGDAIVKEVHTDKGTAVEKGQLLLSFRSDTN